MNRPYPPDELADDLRMRRTFVPAPEIRRWAFETFIWPGGELRNAEHEYLEMAHVDFLWTSVPNSKNGRDIAGTAEIPDQGAGGKWVKARARQQLSEWFGGVPDFLITLDAVYASVADDATFCAMVEHELYHCGQAKDEFGMPKFRRDGGPIFAIRAHDAEEFVGVVRRYGAGSAAGGVAGLVGAARRAPEIAEAKISAVCGRCVGAA